METCTSTVHVGMSGRRLVLAAAALAVLGCGGDDPQGSSVSVVIGPAGGFLVAPGGAQISVPVGAVSAPFTLTASTVGRLAQMPGQAVVATPLRLTPKSQGFLTPATVTIPLTASLPAGRAITDVVVLTGDIASNSLTPLATTPSGPSTVVATITVVGDLVTIVPLAGDADGGVSVPQYMLQADSTVLHGTTGLFWQTTITGTSLDQPTAATHCANLNVNGTTGFRLPTFHELQALVDQNVLNVPFEPTVFSGLGTQVLWTATAYAGAAGNFNHLYTAGGRMTNAHQSNLFDALCVRGTDTRPAPTFVDNGDGTVADTASGRLWQKSSSPTALAHPDAEAYCAALDVSGTTGFRVPTIDELATLMDFTAGAITVDTVMFPVTSGASFWSSTTVPSNGALRWFVAFDQGTVNMTAVDSPGFLVRCVR